MKATVADLKYRTNEVLKALDRNEDVYIVHHGKTKGVLTVYTVRSQTKVTEHPFFNMRQSEKSVGVKMDELRAGRLPAFLSSRFKRACQSGTQEIRKS